MQEIHAIHESDHMFAFESKAGSEAHVVNESLPSSTCFLPSDLTRAAFSPAIESPLALKATTDGIVGRPRGAPWARSQQTMSSHVNPLTNPSGGSTQGMQPVEPPWIHWGLWSCSAPGGGITTKRPSARRTATAELVVPTSRPTDGEASS